MKKSRAAHRPGVVSTNVRGFVGFRQGDGLRVDISRFRVLRCCVGDTPYGVNEGVAAGASTTPVAVTTRRQQQKRK